MRSKKIAFLWLFILLISRTYSQELNARVTVNSSRVNNTVNKNVFQTLQNAITSFLNNRKWTTDNFLTNEKIDCNFLLTLQSTN